MMRTLDLLEQISDVVKIETGSKSPEIYRMDDESLPLPARGRLL